MEYACWLSSIDKTGRGNNDLPIYRPVLRQGMDQIRSFLGKDVVDEPAAGYLALTTICCRVETVQGHNIPGISVEDLFAGRVGRSTDGTLGGDA